MGGYTQTELDDIQAKWELRFPPDLMALYRERRTVIPDKGFDWISASDEIIADALRWPFEGFLFDAHRNGFWWSEWGSRPEGEEDLEAKLRSFFSSAPKLIPVFGHRYLPEEPYESGNPIFSALKMAQAQEKPSKSVFDLLVSADAEGDARATYALAKWHLHGSPFTKHDLRLAAKMLRRAVAAGVSEAAYDLAVCYETGEGIRKSLSRAFENYVRGALLGDAQSHYEVGRMYFYGLGVQRSRVLADIWLAKAEALGIEDRG